MTDFRFPILRYYVFSENIEKCQGTNYSFLHYDSLNILSNSSLVPFLTKFIKFFLKNPQKKHSATF